MKNILFAMMALVALASCSKDPNLETNEMLEGEWNLTSYTIDGEDVYGPDGLFNDGVMIFAMDDDFTGSLETTMTVFPGTEFESRDSSTSSYEISNEGGTITVTDSDGEETIVSVSFEDDMVTLEFTQDDQQHVQKAQKQ